MRGGSPVAAALLGAFALVAATNQEATFIGARAKYWAFPAGRSPANSASASDKWVRTRD